MTADKWAALREPFAPEHIQKRPGGGGQLSYVSHGHVTDRLLAVDPQYVFAPLLDSEGRPLVVLDGLAPGDKVGVWAKLYMLGTPIVEFCSGRDLMDAYSRCLCRCAMRRGVALDLWIGDDIPAEARKEGGLGDAPVPKTWPQIEKWYVEHGGPGAWPLCQEMVKAYMIHQHGTDNKSSLTTEEREVVKQKAAGATVWLAENGANVVGPLPPSIELYQRAWAHVLGGHVLEGMEWTSPVDEAEAIAEEVFSDAS